MISVKQLIQEYGPKIDWDKKAKEKAKELGVSVTDIKKEWDDAKTKGLYKGKYLHECKQKEMDGKDSYIRYEYEESSLHNPEFFPELYKVHEGIIYDEKPFRHPHVPLIGIPDRIQIKDGKVNIIDFKSDKVIYKHAKSFKNGRFVAKYKFKAPIEHLDWCNYIQYNLQLSLYMRLILDNNKTLKPGKLEILHTIFDEDTLVPIEEVIYEVPYMRKEVTALLKKLKK